MSRGRQLAELLDIAEGYRVEHCRALLAAAGVEARAILKAAHNGARRDLRAALSPARERLAAEIAAAESRLITLRRLSSQEHVTGILRQAWPRLVQALRVRWDTPAGRAAWVEQHLAVALKALPAKAWLIRHPKNWPAAERERASRWLQAHGIDGACFESDVEMDAGIRVVCGLNVLDATLEGLLADRAQIEGRLLHHLAAVR